MRYCAWTRLRAIRKDVGIADENPTGTIGFFDGHLHETRMRESLASCAAASVGGGRGIAFCPPVFGGRGSVPDRAAKLFGLQTICGVDLDQTGRFGPAETVIARGSGNPVQARD